MKGEKINIKEFAQIVISKMNKRITNEIFILIQNDRQLMQEYLDLVHEHGAHSVHSGIGKEIKRTYGLKNLNDREDNPSCTLIQSHQKFE